MSTTTAAPTVPDVNVMRVIHRVFRRELALVPDLVRTASPGDRRRAETITGHLDLLLSFLHTHHSGEDELLWPLLQDRAAPRADLVDTMERQHGEVEALTARTREAQAAWRADPTSAAGEALARSLDDLRATLVEHLDLEEREVLPLVERHVTPAEWDALGEHGRSHTARSDLPLVFGAILEDATEEERAELLAAVPAPVRFFLRTAGARQYRRHVSRVRGS